MKRFKPIRIAAMLLVMLLACLFAPASSLAASGMANDNHTDTNDYCLRAHDVTVSLSEFSTKSRSQLESEILSASAFEFYDRATWNSVTSGYAVDFSNLTAAASSSGYTVSVTLPAVTLAVPSVVTFRVFVEDNSRTVSYFFVSNTPAMSLPPDVLAQQPASAHAFSGDSVTPDAPFHTVRDGAGVWSFSGWSPESAVVDTSDVSFYGGWVWTALPVYSVTYHFASTASGHPLPASVLSKLPADTSGVEGDVFTVPGSYHSVEDKGGTWRFSGWDSTSQTIGNSDLVFTGYWRWRAYTPSAGSTPTPMISVSPASESPQPTVTPTLAPETPTPTLSQIQVLEQTDENSPPPQTNPGDTGAGVVAAQAAVASTLGGLVATQAFAIAGDIKVLNWYQLKKAAARRVRR
ncbi:MAG: SHIRT domain-containing protein [Christensenella sp.]|nr:SHIRT domain-containing protein [Christensenella sp.]